MKYLDYLKVEPKLVFFFFMVFFGLFVLVFGGLSVFWIPFCHPWDFFIYYSFAGVGPVGRNFCGFVDACARITASLLVSQTSNSK